MTTDEAAWLSATGAVEAADVLKRLQDSALGLLAGLDRAPRSLRIKVGQVEIAMDWPEQAPAAAEPAAAATSTSGVDRGADGGAGAGAGVRQVTAHMVGVFYRSPEPGAKPFVEVGDEIAPGQQVGIIEAMKLMMPVESEVAGRIVEVLAADGAPVEYGDPLFAFEPLRDP